MSEKEVMGKAHRHREDLTGEHKTGDAGQAIFALLFMTVWITDTFVFEKTTFLNQIIPNVLRTSLGVIILVFSGWLVIRSMHLVFGEVPDEPRVIRKGPFKLVRHPIYLSEILLYFGLLLFSISLAAAVVWLGSIVFLHFISRYEEKLLLQRFGDEYKRYMQEVPMWFPRLK